MKTVQFTKELSESITGITSSVVHDNIMILYYHNLNNQPMLVPVLSWKSLENAGQIAIGVVITEAGRMLVVAPTGAVNVEWSSSNQDANGYKTTSIRGASADMDGENNTAGIISSSKSDFVTNTSSQAAGFCNLYSRVNTDGKGIPAGRWWLPSLAELYLIYRNHRRINYALKHIAGSQEISGAMLWSSTQRAGVGAWRLFFNTGYVDQVTRTTKLAARPISIFRGHGE